MADSLRACKPSRYVTRQPVQLSLAISPWVGAMMLAMGHRGLIKYVGPETRTAGIYHTDPDG